MRFNIGQNVKVMVPSGGIFAGEKVTIIDAEKKASVEIYKATNGSTWGYFTKDMLEEVEVLPKGR